NDGWPHTPLVSAAKWGHVELIRALIEGGADVNRPNNSGETPLLCAVMEGHEQAAEALLRLGADPNLVPTKRKYDTVTNYSPFEYAALDGTARVGELLRAAGGREKAKKLCEVAKVNEAQSGEEA